MKVKLLAKKEAQKFINILPTIVAIWFALWPQRACDELAAISSTSLKMRWNRWKMEEPADDDDDAAGFAFASAHDQKQEIRVNLLYVYLLGWQKKRVTQFISSLARHKSGQQQAAIPLEGSQLPGRSFKYPVIYDFVNLVRFNRQHASSGIRHSAGGICNMQIACQTSLLLKSFVFLFRLARELLRNRTWNEITKRARNKCG